MGVLPRALTTVPQVKTSSTLASVSGSNPESESELAPETDQNLSLGLQQLVPRSRRLKLPLPDDSASIASRHKYGKRKQRRFMNRDYLLSKVDEEGEVDAMHTAFNLMEFRKSPFQRLYELMSAVAALATLDSFDTLDTEHRGQSTPGAIGISKERHPYKRISRRIRHFIKDCVRKSSRAKVVVQVVRQTESEILSLRSGTECESTVELRWKSYIQRLLLHAVAQYHGLRSATVLTDKGGTPVVRVTVTPSHPDESSQSSLLHDLLHFDYTDALANALADVVPNNHGPCNTEA